MPPVNLGNVVGLLKSLTEPVKKYIIWSKILDESDPNKTELYYYNHFDTAWQLFDSTKGFYLPPVKSAGLNDPPATPAAGDAYIIGATPTGSWSSHANKYVYYNGFAWSFLTPKAGQICGNLTVIDQIHQYQVSGWVTYELAPEPEDLTLTGMTFNNATSVANNDNLKIAIVKLQSQLDELVFSGDFIPLAGTGVGNNVSGNIQVNADVIIGYSGGSNWDSVIQFQVDATRLYSTSRGKQLSMVYNNLYFGSLSYPTDINKGFYNLFVGDLSGLTLSNTAVEPGYNFVIGTGTSANLNSSMYNIISGNLTNFTLQGKANYNLILSNGNGSTILNGADGNVLIGAWPGIGTFTGHYNFLMGNGGGGSVAGNHNFVYGMLGGCVLTGSNNLIFGNGGGDQMDAGSSGNWKIGDISGSVFVSSSKNFIWGQNGGHNYTSSNNNFIITDSGGIIISSSNGNFFSGTMTGTNVTNGSHKNALFGDISAINITNGSSWNFMQGAMAIGTTAMDASTYNFFSGTGTIQNIAGSKNFIRFGSGTMADLLGSNNFIVTPTLFADISGDNNKIFNTTSGTSISGNNNFIIGYLDQVIDGNNNFIAQLIDAGANGLSISADYNIVLGAVGFSGSAGLQREIVGNNNILIGNINVYNNIGTTNNMVLGAAQIDELQLAGYSGNVVINVGNFAVDRSNAVFIPDNLVFVHNNSGTRYLGTILATGLTQNTSWVLPSTSGTLATKENSGGWYKYTFTYADVVALGAVTSGNLNLHLLLAGWNIETIRIKHSTAFTGGSISALTASVGIASEVDRYSMLFNLMQPVAHDTIYLNAADYTESQSNNTQIVLNFQATGDNLDQLTAGEVTVWIKLSETL